MFMSTTTESLEVIVSKCERFGSYYTAQTILAFIDDILKNNRNMGHLIAFMNLKNKIIKTSVDSTSLKLLYIDVLNVIEKHDLNSPDVLKLKQFIVLLKQKSIL